jgi:hypothetical protein
LSVSDIVDGVGELHAARILVVSHPTSVCIRGDGDLIVFVCVGSVSPLVGDLSSLFRLSMRSFALSVSVIGSDFSSPSHTGSHSLSRSDGGALFEPMTFFCTFFSKIIIKTYAPLVKDIKVLV